MKTYQRKYDMGAIGARGSASHARFPVSAASPDAVQRCCASLIASSPKQVAQKKNTTGMPDAVKESMQGAFQRDFSDVTIHPASSRAPAVGALAYTQGTDIHFAPGQYKPGTIAGRELLGHELAHVVQQREGRVTPTCEIAGMPVNDNPRLESEADALGKRAARG